MNAHDVDQDTCDGKGEHTPFWMFYTSDWAGAVIGFTLEQRGFYFECLRRMWERKDGLVDEVKWLAAAISCDPRTVRRLRSFLINQGKLQPVNGLLINQRAMRDIAKWKRRAAAKLKGSSGEDQAKLDLNFPKNPTNSKVVPFPAGGISDSSSSSRAEERKKEAFREAGTDDDDPYNRRRELSPRVVALLNQKAGAEEAAHVLLVYFTSTYARDARIVDKAFPRWLEKVYRQNITEDLTAKDLAAEIMALCGGSTALPTGAQLSKRKNTVGG